jgi:hypothetical protein
MSIAFAALGTCIIVFSAASSSLTAAPAAQPTSAVSEETVDGKLDDCGDV